MSWFEENSILIILGFVNLLSILFYRIIAKKLNILDIPNDRSSHTKPIIRGMGIAMIPGVLIALLVLYLNKTELLSTKNTYDIFPFYKFKFLAISLIIGGITGFLDDRLTLSNKIRLPLYALAVLIVIWFGQDLNLNGILIAAIAIVLVGAVNTYNFMDGINGITTLYSLSILPIPFALLSSNIECQMVFPNYILISLIIFLLIFAFFNVRKNALAFLGDSGSVLLGIAAVYVVYYVGVKFGTWTSITLLLVYGVDSVGTILIRLLKKENIFAAHRSHLYQDLVHKHKWSHLKTAFLYAGLQAGINFGYISFLFKSQELYFFVVLVLLIIAFVLIKKSNGSLKNIKLGKS